MPSSSGVGAVPRHRGKEERDVRVRAAGAEDSTLREEQSCSSSKYPAPSETHRWREALPSQAGFQGNVLLTLLSRVLSSVCCYLEIFSPHSVNGEAQKEMLGSAKMCGS